VSAASSSDTCLGHGVRTGFGTVAGSGSRRRRRATSSDISNPTVLVDLTNEDGGDAIDGIKVDAAGNLFVCGPGGIWVIAPDGTKLGLLTLPEAPHNLAWDDDGTLYVAATTSVYRLVRPTHQGATDAR